MSVAIALFTRDLRVHDNPVLHAAARAAQRVVPLFVLDTGITSGAFNRPNRAAFLADCLADLDHGLRERGAALVIRRGHVAAEVCRLAGELDADEIHVAADVSGYAARREAALRKALAPRALFVHDATITVVPPAAVSPAGKDHFAVFTPYFRRWLEAPKRKVLRAPSSLRLPDVDTGELPGRPDIATGEIAPELPQGGEREARRLLRSWLADVGDYPALHDDLAADGTSRLSPHLHFGSLSPTELVSKTAKSTDFVRQVAWRDFHHQVLAANPAAALHDYRTKHDRWRRSAKDLRAWREGRTGYPIVDAGMRQLLREGWMHNRARLIVGSFLCKTLYLDWRLGARHFTDLLVDADVANNQLNWQWVAGTGTDSRPNRVLNPLRQALRYDPDGDYVRRYVPELAGVAGAAVHEPWRLPAEQRAGLDYPPPMVDLPSGAARFREARGI
ncbi:deoxyribodipyrimidine photolyase [Prauserella marina]|uniref:Deoxyribodipyrimidine photo-lyase n=1 Tax=Prauserella marina TaxID=530584 RepID=A0A222VU15_9PSEU|nr:deoxyribodipyrimidine photo-lyase [Prauserella marina]ASR37417.1 deoxyribodipyrimidine photolyase [Prauserella marina]PWV74703.1 deoxyribodipyrimidine photo-lyase type I [Prauserella marina]SDD42890.1 deoxyribodipyrimidine photo-lyase [Prauserella marina]